MSKGLFVLTHLTTHSRLACSPQLIEEAIPLLPEFKQFGNIIRKIPKFMWGEKRLSIVKYLGLHKLHNDNRILGLPAELKVSHLSSCCEIE